MKQNYNHKKIEKKWQAEWEEEKIYQVDLDKAKKPFYNLMMFPYPSAEGLHVGNMYAFVHSDTYGRFMRLKGYDVFEPIGLDGFGIHSENYAIKIGEHIKDVSARTEKHFYKQLHMIGNAYDWSRTVETYKPNYYKWTQWLFLKMYEKGLAYRKKSSVNWCPSCKTVLSDEQVITGRCERCDTETEKKEMEQWFWRITDYAEKLLKNLETIDWSEEVKTIQRNWIGKSEGALVKFQIINSKSQINPKSKIQNPKLFLEVFTTRPDTLFGATYFVISPEHPLIENYKLQITNYKEVESYIKKSKKKSDIERTDLAKEKTGVELKGVKAINPVNNEEIPVWIADYVMMSYGTGAIMAVPAHDERDWEFAKKYNLPVVCVNDGIAIKLDNINKQTEFIKLGEQAFHDDRILKDFIIFKYGIFGLVFIDEKSKIKFFNQLNNEKIKFTTAPFIWENRFVKLINSDRFNSFSIIEAKEKIIKWLEKNKVGKGAVNYKLRDWCISRQRYWGPPIPMIECSKCGWQPVPEKDLPVELPEVDNFLPDGSGKGPLNKIKDFVNTTCPKCGGSAKRETDVSDPFVDSCWYFMRYLNAHDEDKPFDKLRARKWMPVDMYIGGKEHSVLHLLYSRFVTMVMHELEYVPEEEPYKQFQAHGLLIAEGAKISKSKGNIINPDKYIEEFGADAMRMYLMFLGDMRQGGDWQDNGVNGMYRFVKRIYEILNKINSKSKISNSKQIQNSDDQNSKIVSKLLHKTIKGVGEDLENLKYNTAIAKLMIFFNGRNGRPDWRPKLNSMGEWEAVSEIGKAIDYEAISKFLIILAPFAPHLAEELWSEFGNKESIFKEKWPEYDKDLIKDKTINLVVQINGKLRDTISVSADISENKAKAEAMKSEKIKKWIEDKKVVKTIFVKGKLINMVIK